MFLSAGDIDVNRNGARTRKRKLIRDSGSYPLPEFIAVDGEGVPDETCTGQKYVLLGVGDRQTENPSGLSFQEVCSFLYGDFLRNPKAVYVGFYLGYDFAHWLKGIPESRARSLFTSEGISARQRRSSSGNTVPFPVRYAGWEFDLLPGNRRFRLRPACCGKPWDCNHKGAGWLYICDAGPFFQTSLLNAINPSRWKDDPIVSEDEWNTLLAGKEARGTAVLDDDMRRYNALENMVFSRLMERQAIGLRGMGVKLSKDQWFGPGQVSAVWLSKQGVPRRKDAQSLPYRRFQEIARRSYYGGWFEIFMHGRIPGTSYGYDINSAYPHVMSRLPCLLHGNYSYGNGRDYPLDSNAHTLIKGTVEGKDGYIGAVPHRTHTASICRPIRSRGYFWLSELEAGKRAGVVHSWSCERWWSYEPCQCPTPLAGLSDLYQLRQNVGKDTSLGKAAKLVYNSAYGKFAQSVGEAPFGNWVYASLTTSGCRSIILDAIATHPHGVTDVEMVATDGIYFRTPHPGLPLSERLGDWSESRKEGLCLFKPGFYWDDESKLFGGFRARGIRAGDFATQIPAVEAAFHRIKEDAQAVDGGYQQCKWPAVYFTSRFAITSPLLALRQGDWSRAGAIQTNKPLRQSSDPTDKRIPAPFLSIEKHWDTPVLRTMPYETPPGDGILSTPYEKHYGDEDPWSPERMEALGLTEDGPAGIELQLMREALHGNE